MTARPLEARAACEAELTAAPRPVPAERLTLAVLIVGGLAALWFRPTLIEVADAPLVLAVLFGGLLAAGLIAPVPATVRQPVTRVIAVTAIGISAVCAAQLLVGHPRVVPLAGRFVFLNIVAAIAEEAFFRRLLFGVLRPYGVMIAIVGSAAAFSAVHLTTYGAWVLPLDFAVGLLFGWQREASGTWTAPAITHVIANLLVVW